MKFQPQVTCARADCREYLRTGKCKFANHCKYNHPPVNCRDYLRTGKCKYGSQCKYIHPSWVQGGVGGIKERINPCKPLFPIRPSEPHCPYFLRYGNCKFGQTCKFHHPPGSLNAFENDDVLAQRPTEPDCIFFLKNGHCKFGSTCKFHHPLSILGIIDDIPGSANQSQYHTMNNNGPLQNDQLYVMGIHNFSTSAFPVQISENPNSTVLLPIQTIYKDKEILNYLVRNTSVATIGNTSNIVGATPVINPSIRETEYDYFKVSPPSTYPSTTLKHAEVHLNAKYATNYSNDNRNFAVPSQEMHLLEKYDEESYMGYNHFISSSPPRMSKPNESWSRDGEEAQTNYHNMSSPSYEWKPKSDLIQGRNVCITNKSSPIKSPNNKYSLNEKLESNSMMGYDLSILKPKKIGVSMPFKLDSQAIFSDDYNRGSSRQYYSNDTKKMNETNEYQKLDEDDDGEALSKMMSTILNLIDTPSDNTEINNESISSSAYLHDSAQQI